MIREKKIPEPEGYPLFGWTSTTVKAHLQAQPPGVGDAMIIYNAHGGFHAYPLATVVNPSAGRQKRSCSPRPAVREAPRFTAAESTRSCPKVAPA
ncbi:hypothetical protein [Stenotrophomonas maltophilia]|uniref:hypothetical protein n=1 Tax=Stenotrophomonas maltophilia TaxID=40324 RepID=UPI0011AF4BB6|nr:hypothetical protein [Stenotrophomonas maltophilia]MCM2523603.1 hypothetical protein [Stenotrophomonas maltophilia]MCU1126925.1 hypothetical protein [Stenotrophomonas maltophilia]UQY96695.1 hypothetical protein LZ605_04835 [Stenotrophomonas maltophilia]UXB18177.1 hypothetical protein K7566_11130 [Stenotrophomonas maltophilia]UXB38972.1 hypothetical protein K7569_14700 [Stenotrophomonas maltophilia]